MDAYLCRCRVYYDGTYSTSYYYITNLQGDVVAITNASHAIVAEYVYDAWGNILAIKNGSGTDISGDAAHIANLNPIRYRGYFYDTETGFYYLQSRYYDPVVGRFINGDAYASTGTGFLGYNMYAYCENNPVLYIDFAGSTTVSIREFVESRDGQATWFSILGIAVFCLNGKTLVTTGHGYNMYGFDIYNYKGRMKTQDYYLAYYFDIDNWIEYMPGFKWYTGKAGEEATKGFEVVTDKLFLNKSFCWDFAGEIIDMKGKKGQYLGQYQFGIAAECYAHAVIKYVSDFTINTFDRGYSYHASAKEIGYIANDPNSVYYKMIWYIFL